MMSTLGYLFKLRQAKQYPTCNEQQVYVIALAPFDLDKIKGIMLDDPFYAEQISNGLINFKDGSTLVISNIGLHDQIVSDLNEYGIPFMDRV